MTFPDLRDLLTAHFGPEIILAEDAATLQPHLLVPTARIAEVCRFLHENDQTYFDLLECLTSLDNGPGVATSESGTMEIAYTLYSIPYEHHLTLKIRFPRHSKESESTPGDLPEVPTVSTVWRTADWHEREAYDLMGIRFTGHPDLRRLFLPEDWQGHPLRKDYTEQEAYHGIKVRYGV